jgi:hypothetical protein
LLDGIHTHSGMTQYATPWLWQMAIWTPPLFGFATVAIAGTNVLSDRFFPRAAPVPSWTACAAGVVVFSLAYYASGYLPASNATKTVLLVAIAAACWTYFERTPQGIVLALFAGACGVAAEHFLTVVGAFHHVYPNFLDVPFWLPALYMVGSVTIGNVGRRVVA